MADDFASLHRRLKALESNRGAVLRFGTVTEVDEKAGAARVKIDDAGGTVTAPLRVMQRRALKDQEQSLPDIGEHVACLFSGQGFEQGLIIGAHYSDKNPSPARPAHVWYYKFEDNTEIEYDRQEHRLTMNISGDIIIKARGTIKMNAAHISIQE
ncbi:MAG: phage baseplate assembly protein V [Desulfobulbaceae bacterium]|jgi:phage baseplate assembly protein V|nr:phage baseplate assembly protein V [Desulfobulbaceae bacterium]